MGGADCVEGLEVRTADVRCRGGSKRASSARHENHLY
jgi:hypothetical protein